MINYKCDIKRVTFIKRVNMKECLEKIYTEKWGLEKALNLFYYGNVAEMLLSLYGTEQ